MHHHQTKQDTEDEEGASMTSHHHHSPHHPGKEATDRSLFEAAVVDDETTETINCSNSDISILVVRWQPSNENPSTIQEMLVIFLVLLCSFLVAFSISFLILWKQQPRSH